MYEPTLQLELFRDSSDLKWNRSSCADRGVNCSNGDQICHLELTLNAKPILPSYLMLSKLTECGCDRIKHDPDRITQGSLEIE